MGRLMFSVPHGQSGTLPSTWKEDDQHRLEDMLPQIIRELPAQIERWQVTLSDRQCEYRQLEQIRARQSAKAKRDADEAGWEKSILESMQKWQQAGQIRAYLDAVRRSVDCGYQRVRDQKLYENWQAWATHLATKFDPLMGSIPRPGEDTAPVNTPVSEIDLTSVSRAVVDALGVKDTNEIGKLTEEDLSARTSESRKVVDELRRVLEGLGYTVVEQRRAR